MCSELNGLVEVEATSIIATHPTRAQSRIIPKLTPTTSRREREGTQQQPTIMEPLVRFDQVHEVSLYLFNDQLLKATHVKVQDFLGRTRENIKLSFATKSDPIRPTSEEGGVETLHKFKFQRMDGLDTVTVSDFPDEESLENGFVVHWPNGAKYYQASSVLAKAGFIGSFQATCDKLNQDRNDHLAALTKRFKDEQMNDEEV